MKKLRHMLQNNACITISQSTKDGKMRGSSETGHECGIEVQVTEGTAITTKNRFSIPGKEFKVY